MSSFDADKLYKRWCSENAPKLLQMSYFWLDDRIVYCEPGTTRKEGRREQYRFESYYRNGNWSLGRPEVGTNSDDPSHAGKTLSKLDRKDLQEDVRKRLQKFHAQCLRRQESVADFLIGAEKTHLAEWERGSYDFFTRIQKRVLWFRGNWIFSEEWCGDRVWFDTVEPADTLQEALSFVPSYSSP